MGPLCGEGSQGALRTWSADVGGLDANVPGFAVSMEDGEGCRFWGRLLVVAGVVWVDYIGAEFDASCDALVSVQTRIWGRFASLCFKDIVQYFTRIWLVYARSFGGLSC